MMNDFVDRMLCCCLLFGVSHRRNQPFPLEMGLESQTPRKSVKREIPSIVCDLGIAYSQ
jgi:hypothetical protein